MTHPTPDELPVDAASARLYELAEAVATRHDSTRYLYRVAPEVEGDIAIGDPVKHLFHNAQVGGRYMAAETARAVLAQAVTNHYDLSRFATQIRPLRAALRLLAADPCVVDVFLTTQWTNMSIPGTRLLMQALDPTLDAQEVEDSLTIIEHAILACLEHDRLNEPCADHLD